MIPLKSAVKHLLPPILVLCVINAIFAITLHNAWKTEREISDTRYAMQQEQLTAAVNALLEQREELEELTRRIEQLQTELEQDTAAATAFRPMDIPLSPELQRFTVAACEVRGIEPDILFAIMERESRYQIDAVGYNQNGTTDHGLCQINSVNRDWLLEDHGLDIMDPAANIEAAAVILSGYLERYTLEEALASYAVGESGMLAGGGMWFAEEILRGGI